MSTEAKMSEPEAANEAATVALTPTRETIWTNQLIWDEITGYLRIADLKALSLVNKQILDKIRESPRLVFNQTLKTNLEVYVPVLNRAVVEVNKINEYYLGQFGSDVFENVTYLELQRLRKKSKQIKNSLIKRMICHCKMLKSLAFGAYNFSRKDYQDIFSDEVVKQILSELDELHFGVENKNYPYPSYDTFKENFEDSDSSEDESFPWWYFNTRSRTHPLENRLFPDLDLKLKKFSSREPNYFRASTNFYPELILGSSANLADIDVDLDILGLHGLNSITIPNLRSLKLQFYNGVTIPGHEQVFMDKLIPFITRHADNLETFALYGLMEYSLAPICNVLMNSKKIRSISLRSSHHFGDSIKSMDWNFLQTLSTLRTFELKMFEYENYEEDKMIDEVYLINQTPEIVDSWLRYLMALPSTVTSIQMFAFWKEEENPQSFQVTEALAKFQNLTELSMLLCFEFLLDDTLQFICSHLTKLRILKADFSKITDYGISGCRRDGSDSGISLKSLKGLNELNMSFCHRYCRTKITWKGLLSSVKFLELIHLSVGGSLKDLHGDSEQSDSRDADNYLKLIQQNPSLETCCLKFYRPEFWLCEEARKLSTRLKFNINSELLSLI